MKLTGCYTIIQFKSELQLDYTQTVLLNALLIKEIPLTSTNKNICVKLARTSKYNASEIQIIT